MTSGFESSMAKLIRSHVQGAIESKFKKILSDPGNPANSLLKKIQSVATDNLKVSPEHLNDTLGDAHDPEGGNTDRKAQAIKRGAKYCESIYQIEKLGADNISNSILKAIVSFFVYMSYATLAIAIILIVTQGTDQKQLLVDFVTQESGQPFIFSLLIIAIMVIIIYENYTKNQALEPNARKFLNFAIDWLRVVFHIVFLVWIQAFVFNQPKKPIEFAFWALVVGDVFLVLRSLLKWIHFYCGSGSKNMENWQKIFKFDQQSFRKHIQMIVKLKGKIPKKDKKTDPKDSNETKPQTKQPSEQLALQPETSQIIIAPKSDIK